MKKTLNLLLISSIILVTACGPSEEEKAAKEQARLDSIAAVEKAIQDSIAAAEAAAAAEQALKDSIAAANQKMLEDSLANLSGKLKGIQQKAKEQKAKEEKTKKEYEQQSKGKG